MKTVKGREKLTTEINPARGTRFDVLGTTVEFLTSPQEAGTGSAAGKYGYWNATPEENAAVGIYL
jgi:hypothetical protein